MKLRLSLDDLMEKINTISLDSWSFRKVDVSKTTENGTHYGTRKVYRGRLGKYSIDVEREQTLWNPAGEEAISLAMQGSSIPVAIDSYKLRVMYGGKVRRIFDIDKRINDLYKRIDKAHH